jgi:hypothetical protein
VGPAPFEDTVVRVLPNHPLGNFLHGPWYASGCTNLSMVEEFSNASSIPLFVSLALSWNHYSTIFVVHYAGCWPYKPIYRWGIQPHRLKTIVCQFVHFMNCL